MLEGATGAIWKCALDAQCNEVLCASSAVESLVPLLTDQPEEVLVRSPWRGHVVYIYIYIYRACLWTARLVFACL